jgi:hypothetical protein
MNYQWHYDQLMITRKDRIPEKGQYYERHHIIPKSLGGDNSPENLVILTAREHFIAHWLLWLLHRNRKTACAFWSMCRSGSKNSGRITSSKMYAIAKEASSITMSEFRKGKKMSDEFKSNMSTLKKGNTNRLGKTTSIETRKKQSDAKKGKIFTTEHRENIGKSQKNIPKIGLIGVPKSEEHKEKISKILKEKVTCPHCGVEGGKFAMQRFHFKNCKKFSSEL